MKNEKAAQLREKMAEKGAELTVTDGAKEIILEKGYDVKFGARPLKRALQSQLEDKLAEEFLSGGIKENMNVRVHAMIDEDNRKKLVFVGNEVEVDETEDDRVLLQ